MEEIPEKGTESSASAKSYDSDEIDKILPIIEEDEVPLTEVASDLLGLHKSTINVTVSTPTVLPTTPLGKPSFTQPTNIITPADIAGATGTAVATAAGVTPALLLKQEHFTENFLRMIYLCTHISALDREKLKYSIIPLLENFKKTKQRARAKFGIVKYLFMILGISVPALMALSPISNRHLGEIATVLILTGLAIILGISAKLYQSFTKSYIGYNTGYDLMQKEATAFFFLTNEYAKHKNPFTLFVSRMLSLIYEVNKTDLVTSPVDSSEQSMIADINQLEAVLEKRRDEDIVYFTSRANLPLFKGASRP